jgi:glycosyltransferase involved in cell wall biosynthesis
MSPYDSLINETRVIKKHSLLAKLIYHYERSILRACDQILTDTDLHKRYFQILFQIKSKKIKTIPIGTDEELFYPTGVLSAAHGSVPFEVLYYGSFLPLHGINIILDAALALIDIPVHFTLIGGNRLDLSEFCRKIEIYKIHNVDHISWVDFENLPDYIARADLGLGGAFGGTGQARRVITGKTFQFLAMAKPVVVGEIDEDCGFEDKVNCLIVRQKDAKSLARAILWAFQNKSALPLIGRRGYDLYRLRYSVKEISERIMGCLTIPKENRL